MRQRFTNCKKLNFLEDGDPLRVKLKLVFKEAEKEQRKAWTALGAANMKHLNC